MRRLLPRPASATRPPAPRPSVVPCASRRCSRACFPDGFGECPDLCVREGGLTLDLAVQPESPAVWFDPGYRIGQPVGGGVGVAGEASLLTRAGEAATPR